MDINNNKRKFTYYSRIVMMIIMTFELILNLIFIITIVEVKDTKYEKECADYEILNSLLNYNNDNNGYNYNNDYYNNDYYNNYPFRHLLQKQRTENDVITYHYRGISASFSLFFVAYFVFFVEFLAYFTCENCNEILELILKKLNHLLLLITFFIGQFLYLVDCMIIPIYYQRINKFNYKYFDIFCDTEEIEKIKKKIKNKYILLIVFCYVFLLLILFLDFIVLNLYKDICCKMAKICKSTQDCCENFGRGFVNKLGILFCKNERDQGIVRLEDLENENDKQIHELTGEIRHLLADYIELNTKDL